MGGVGLASLPARRTAIVGREGERAAVREQLLRPEVRLLTLTGAPGIGKTRLAEAVAADTVAEFADGVRWIDLAALPDPSMVPGAVASALGIREEPDQALLSALADALRARKLLLVLDNCERLADACADLAGHLLSRSPGVRILVTSRKALGVPRETLWRVPPLSLPGPGEQLTPQAAMESDAIRLFVERARDVRDVGPAFAITQENVGAVIEVCRRLEGISLALELVAPRLTLLSVEQIAERLRRKLLHVLAPNQDPIVHHQQTLQSTLDWSHALLSRQEQVLFRRLAVFAGGWTVDAAEAICAGGEVAADDVLDLLRQLQRQSLIAVKRVEQGITSRGILPVVRSSQLAVVREYAAGHLEASGEEDTVRRAYADYYLCLVEAVDPELRGPEQRARADGLETEHDNLRAVLAWSVERVEKDGAETGLRLAASLWWFWFIRGHVSEGRRWLEQALAANPDAPSDVRAAALCRSGHLAWVQGDFDVAEGRCQEAETLYQELADKSGVATARGIRAYVTFAHGEVERAVAMGEEVLGLMRETQNLWGEAMACVGLGVCAHRLGDHGRARALLERALTLSRRLGDKRAEGEARNNLGIVAREQGSFAEAVAQHRASRELFHELRDTWQEAGALIDLGTALAADGAFAQAGIQIRASLQLYRDLGDKRGIVACLEQLARLAATIRQGRRAARLFGAAEALRRTAALSLLPAELADHELRECEARQQLGSAAFERAWAAGGTMSWERAIAYALRPDSPLTRRQEEVARLAALGLSNREIAARLGITEGGVANNMERIRAKLNLQSRAQLALWAIEHGLLEDLGE